MQRSKKTQNPVRAMALALALISSLSAYAQSEGALKFISKYQEDESFSYVTVSSKMISLFSSLEMSTPEEKELMAAMSKIKGLRILSKENTRHARDLYKEAMSSISPKEYEELVSVRDKDQDFRFYVKEANGGKISELLMVMGGNDEFMFLTIFGEIDLKQISKIGRQMNLRGLDKLDDKSKKK